MLLHQEGYAQQETAGKGLPPAAGLQVPPEQIGPGQAEEGDKMRGVRRHAQHGRTGREDRVGQSRHTGREGIEKLSYEAVQQHDRGQVHGQQPQVHAGSRLPKDSHQGCVRDIGPRQFHVVGELVGRHALQDQLSGVGEFAFVALQGEFAKPNTNGDGKNHSNRQQSPGDEIDDSRARKGNCHAGGRRVHGLGFDPMREPLNSNIAEQPIGVKRLRAAWTRRSRGSFSSEFALVSSLAQLKTQPSTCSPSSSRASWQSSWQSSSRSS